MPLNITPPDIFTREEDLAGFALRRKKELEAQVSALRGQLVPKEAELAQISQVIATLGLSAAEESSESDFTEGEAVDPPHIVTVPRQLTVNGKAVHLTIKEMVLSALRDHFHEGATPSELREYFRVVYGKDIDRNSISPQLARLRDEGVVHQPNTVQQSNTKIFPAASVWRLGKPASRVDASGANTEQGVAMSRATGRSRNTKDIFE